MKICIIYDCLFPWTIGGAERWYRNLAQRLARRGHDVTYVTRPQWSPDDPPTLPGVRVIAVGPAQRLYTRKGRRRMLPPLVFGVAVALHLVRHRDAYDIVHTASFPYFPLLAASVTRSRTDRIFVDWLEFWPRRYWRAYVGPLGWLGWSVQWLCTKVRQEAFCFAELTATRLKANSALDAIVLRGHYAGPHAGDESFRTPARAMSPPRIVYAGRHTPEKRVPTIVHALAVARRTSPDVRADVFGDGPERGALLAAIDEAGLKEAVAVHGIGSDDDLIEALSTAACVVLPSEREGYGLLVVEAAAHGCPTVLVAGPDNAAVELIEDGVNGVVARSAAPDDLGSAIVRAVEGGDELRRATAGWYAANATSLSIDHSLEVILERYRMNRTSR